MAFRGRNPQLPDLTVAFFPSACSISKLYGDLYAQEDLDLGTNFTLSDKLQELQA